MPRRDSQAARSEQPAGRRLPDSQELAQVRRRLLRWFKGHGRKFPWRNTSASKYQCIIAEALLQRTRAETVASFFPQFIKEFPSWKRLGSASVTRLQRHLQPIGLWRRRAASIRLLGREMKRRNGRFPRDRAEIEALPGVGQYIANAVRLFCHGVPQPLLDASMARVLERVFGPRTLADIRYDPYLQHLARRVVDCSKSHSINWAILDLGALICTPKKPACSVCPLRSGCNYAKGISRARDDA